MSSRTIAWAAATVACCAVGFYLRWLNAHTYLEMPSIDENDVVQQAVAFMGGEWRYREFGYGAFPMYCLTALYHAVAALRGLTAFEYATRVFYDGAEHYLLARLFCVACSLPLAIACYRWGAPRFGRAGASLGACLLSWPVVDLLTQGTVRVDVVQAACQVGSVLFLAHAVESRSWRPWLGAGVLAGLGLASKPLPGLLVAPCFLVASWFAAVHASETAGKGSSPDAKGRLRAFASLCLKALLRPALWVAGAVAVITQFAVNPSSLELRAFIAAQLETSAYYSGPKAPGVHLTPFQALYGLHWPFCVAAALSVSVLLFVRDLRARLIALFPLLYMTAFWGRPTRAYYMVPAALALCIVIGIGVGILLCRLGWDTPAGAASRERPAEGSPAASVARNGVLSVAITLALAAGVIWTPAWDMEEQRVGPKAAVQARHWIHENVPSGTSLFHFGRYYAGPRLVGSSWAEESRLVDFFDYGRANYRFYKEAAKQAYAKYRSAGRPWYEIEGQQVKPQPASSLSKVWLTKSLATRARNKHQQYIIVAGYYVDDYRQLGYTWFDQVELAQQYAGQAILRVSPAPPSEAPPPTGAMVTDETPSSG